MNNYYFIKSLEISSDETRYCGYCDYPAYFFQLRNTLTCVTKNLTLCYRYAIDLRTNYPYMKLNADVMVQ
jgi:hypothetical protein